MTMAYLPPINTALASPRDSSIANAYTPMIPSPLSPRRASAPYSSSSPPQPPPHQTIPQKQTPRPSSSSPYSSSSSSSSSSRAPRSSSLSPPGSRHQPSRHQQPHQTQQQQHPQQPKGHQHPLCRRIGSPNSRSGRGGGSSPGRRGPVSPTQRLMRQKAAAAWKSLVVQRNSIGGGVPGGSMPMSMQITDATLPSSSSSTSTSGGGGGDGLTMAAMALIDLAASPGPSSSSSSTSSRGESSGGGSGASGRSNNMPMYHPLLQHSVQPLQPPPPLPPRPRHHRRSYMKEGDDETAAAGEGSREAGKQPAKTHGNEKGVVVVVVVVVAGKGRHERRQQQQPPTHREAESPSDDGEKIIGIGSGGIKMTQYPSNRLTWRLSLVNSGRTVSTTGGFGDGMGGSTGLGIMSAAVDTEKQHHVVYRYQDHRQDGGGGGGGSGDMAEYRHISDSPPMSMSGYLAPTPRYRLPLRILRSKGTFLAAGILCIVGFLSAFYMNFRLGLLAMKL
jgi:hypothetical protein